MKKETQAYQILINEKFKIGPDGTLIPPPRATDLFKAIEILLASGYTLAEGKFQPPWLTISELLMRYKGPIPSLSTIKRETGKSFQAKKDESRSQYWLIHQPTFNEWLEEWRKSNHRKEENQRKDDMFSLGGQYSDEDLFPDPEGVSLIIIDEVLRWNEFVQEFLDYHGHDLPTVIYENPDKLTNPLPLNIDIKTKKHTILWIGNEDKKPYPRWRCWNPPPNAPKEPNDATGVRCEECFGTGICQVCLGDGCDLCIFENRPGKCTECQGEG